MRSLCRRHFLAISVGLFACLFATTVGLGAEESDLKPRVVVIGFDGMMPEMLLKFADEGVLPNFSRLLHEGTFARALSSAPADTPTNWSTIATGAFPGTHGLNSFAVHVSGEPFDVHHNVMGNLHPRIAFEEPQDQTFNGQCLAEYLWQSAEALGLKSLIVNFPGSWPPNITDGIIVNGSGPYASPTVKLALPHSYSSGIPAEGELSNTTRIALSPAKGWRGEPASVRPPLEAEFQDAEIGVAYHVLVTGSSKYDRVLVSDQKAGGGTLADLRPGQSSPWIDRTFLITLQGPLGSAFLGLAEYKQREFEVVGRFRFTLKELAPDGERLLLERSTVYNPHHWAYPQPIADQLIDYFDAQPAAPPLPISVFSPLALLNENTTTMAKGIVETTRYLAKVQDWDFIFVQIHDPDGINHEKLSFLDPGSPDYSPQEVEGHWEEFRKEYRLLDWMLGSILDCCTDAGTLVVVVSDHGALPVRKVVRLSDFLSHAGLITYKDSADGESLVVDWGQSKIALGDHPLGQSIWVNLKGRDPNGFVEQENYDDVREETIRVLQAIVDPDTGRRVVDHVFRIEDAAAWGDWGPRFGDLVYFLAPGYSNTLDVHSAGPVRKGALSKEPISKDRSVFPNKNLIFRGIHHAFLPTAKLGGFSNHGIFLAKGPRVKAGHRRERPIRLVDVVPTICFWRHLPVPANSEGGAILDIFSQHAAH